MATPGSKRVKKELAVLHKPQRDSGGVTITPKGDSLKLFDATISGPPDTPYAGGTFSLIIELPVNYPTSPPSVRFVSKVWHPNISPNGAICLDVLKEEWNPMLTMEKVLMSIAVLLTQPDPSSPQNAYAAMQIYYENGDVFTRTAKFWTQVYAEGPGERDSDFECKLENERQKSPHNFKLDDVLEDISSRHWGYPVPENQWGFPNPNDFHDDEIFVEELGGANDVPEVMHVSDDDLFVQAALQEIGQANRRNNITNQHMHQNEAL